MLNFEPLINAIAHAKRRKFDSIFANDFRAGDIFIEDLQMEVVANVLNVNVHALVPFRSFTLILGRFSSDTLFASIDDHIRVHLAKSLCISSEFGINYVKSKFA